MKYQLNYEKIPVLSIGFTRSSNMFGGAIRLIRGGIEAVQDKSFPNHVFIVTDDYGQKFATEETLDGLQENSLEKYTKESDRIICMYVWNGWKNHTLAKNCLMYLAEVRRRNKEDSQYDFWGLMSFVPVLKKIFKPNNKKQWCSENVSAIHKLFGCNTIDKTTIAPDELMKLVTNNPEWDCVIGYYK